MTEPTSPEERDQDIVQTSSEPLRRRLRLAIDVLFMLALTIMVVVCAIIAYAIA